MGRRGVAGTLKLERSIVSRLVCRFRNRAVVELESLALRHQLRVLRRQRPGRLRLFTFDRLLWVVLYRLWPRYLELMVLGMAIDRSEDAQGSMAAVPCAHRLSGVSRAIVTAWQREI